jgi:hypothetical protein
VASIWLLGGNAGAQMFASVTAQQQRRFVPPRGKLFTPIAYDFRLCFVAAVGDPVSEARSNVNGFPAAPSGRKNANRER